MPSIEEILLNVKAVSFADMLPQKRIQTDEDKAEYAERYSTLLMTEDEFRKQLPDIDTACVYYTPSISSPVLYFNPETFAVCPLHIMMLLPEPSSFALEQTRKALSSREKEVAQRDFMGSLLSLPDGMRIGYLNALFRAMPQLPDRYKLFFRFYQLSDYGFGDVDPDVLQIVMSGQTNQDKTRTAQQLRDLPDVITVYRGGSVDISLPPERSYSWTTDFNIANFFACRHGVKGGYIATGKIKKTDVIEAFLEGEGELIVAPENVIVLSVTELPGLGYCEKVLPAIMGEYQRQMPLVYELYPQDNTSEDHGKSHTARVILLCLTLANELGLSKKDMRILTTAAAFHDVERKNDGEDEMHGAAGRKRYEASVKQPDPIISFLIEYHSRPDEDGFAAIQSDRKLRKQHCRVELLYQIFKDADALDRVRFGIKDLDLSFLRLDNSKLLTLVARLYYEQVKLPAVWD